jgi:choline dehydrogenase-like flavoprotein
MTTNHYATIIIGSGVAGSTIATKLLEADPNASILMLEAGPIVPMKDRRYWWDYVVSYAQPYAHCYDRDGDNDSVGETPWISKGSRLMIYGGSTVHWGGWSMRFKPEDFNLKSNTGGGGDWPYGYAELEPYYCRAEEYLSVGGDDDDPWRSKPYPMPAYPWTESDGEMVEAFDRLGITPGKMPMARYRKCMATGTCKYCPIGARFSGSYILDDLLAEPRFTYLGQAPALRLGTEESKSKIAYVEYLDPFTAEPVKARGDTIIICSGAYEAPKLLQTSVSFHWEHGIGNDHDLVGRYPVSHPFLSVAGTKPNNPERWIQEYDFPTLMSRTYDTEEYQSNGKIFLMKDASQPNTDIAGQMIAGKTRAEVDAAVSGRRSMHLSAFMEEKGSWADRFTVAQGTTRFGLPRTKIDFSYPSDFVARANKNLGLMSAVLKEMGYENLQPQIGDQDGHHTSSTTRMGTDPTQGVVDEHLKVFGTDNLYVCSNAVLPNCAAVNPTLTLVAVTLKLTDHLLGASA